MCGWFSHLEFIAIQLSKKNRGSDAQISSLKAFFGKVFVCQMADYKPYCASNKT